MATSLTCLLISDTHGEFDRDGGVQMAKELPSKGIDVLLACGDITTLEYIRDVARVLLERFPRVLWVNGNHEFYGARREYVEQELKLLDELPTFHWLHRKTLDIDGFTFAGTTAWWGPHGDNPTTEDIEVVRQYESDQRLIQVQQILSGTTPPLKAEEKQAIRERILQIRRRSINDMFLIPGLMGWVYEEHAADMKWLNEVAPRAHVVMTHLSPSRLSTPHRFLGSPLSRYFSHELDEFVSTRGPQLWVHGHTHEPFDYRLDQTRVRCFPRGYPRERGRRPYSGAIVQVTR